MKATVTLDADVQAAVDRLRAERGISRREAVNEIIRDVTKRVDKPTVQDGWELPSFDLGLRVDVTCASALDDVEFDAHS